ncbi:class I SAM-dependent methyltransferase [Dichotomicrobium thermohalophilum]|uniref:SAM-dependent MidA family methyltransferase n=1 Tax=Dichotomicrobium thermohalophilum TaxID=933063 RepID=A0A397Q409_9HYPH|nr:SAM-dependent methyltransferase [Dichotomicrobium thermohalophilum]RIA55149.1 SAM-dependent MidA family methyltransferase [Dichotomicrobium thermohalophilum]
MTPQSATAATEPTPLARKLMARIAADGPIPVSAYMDACLNDPEHGYYRTAQPLGRSGDFITAPEISQVFGELLGLWAASVWQAMGAPKPVALIELGPGRGTLAADALRAAKALPAFQEALSLHLVETSPVLQSEQARLLGTGITTWHDTINDVPDGPAIIFANEFLDALPVRQLVWRDGEWRERCVAHDPDQGFLFCEGSLAELSTAEQNLLPCDPADGDIAELRSDATGLLAAIRARGDAQPQAALFIDYGHGEAAAGDTLQAVSGHRYAGVFDAPGQHDLTAHVDFRALAKQADMAGLGAFGPMAQGRFLLQLGLEARCQTLLRAGTPAQQQSIMSGARRLVDPTQMGELFKVMAVTAGLSEAPPPFGEQQ